MKTARDAIPTTATTSEAMAAAKANDARAKTTGRQTKSLDSERGAGLLVDQEEK